MFAPFLLAAGLGFGMWWLLRKEESDDESAPPLPETDLDLVSATDGDETGGTYFVLTMALNADEDSHQNLVDFDSWRAAWEYYKQQVAFFDEHHNNWTCPKNYGHISVRLMDEWNSTKAVKTYTECTK